MNVRSFLFFAFIFMISGCSGSPAPIIDYGQYSGAGSAGIHNVSYGDTLYSISNRYRLPMRDIAVLNRLQAPFILYEGQRLRLPPPREYRVQHGDTLYGVSRLFGVNSSEVAQLNHIKAPYTIRVGQVLRMPSLTRKVKKRSVHSVSMKKTHKAVIPPHKPVLQESVVRNGVPIPQYKPVLQRKTGATHISKVSARTPKRAASKFLRPVRGRIISGYGVKKNGLHNDGVNIKAPRGTSVKAAENGVVVYAGSALKGSGNLVLIRHERQWMTAYAHMERITVQKGQVIKRGQIVGKVGSTGSVKTPQLHFEVRRGTSAMNPVKYME